MTWTNRANEVIDSSDSGTPGSVVRHEISFTVVETDDPIEFSCLTNFGPLNPAPGDDEASNVPVYEYPYSSGAITVHCKYCIFFRA